MDLIKVIIIFGLGLFACLYNLFNSNLYEVIKSTEVVVFLQGQISTTTKDTFVGTLFDYLIGLLFNVNIRDTNSYFRIFGG